MTIQQIITYLEHNTYIVGEVTDVCVEALEKQIPKKVENRECPICEEPIPRWDSQYCPACGQKIDWSE